MYWLPKLAAAGCRCYRCYRIEILGKPGFRIVSDTHTGQMGICCDAKVCGGSTAPIYNHRHQEKDVSTRSMGCHKRVGQNLVRSALGAV